MMNAILHDDPAAVARESAEIPTALARVVQRCLEKNPAERFQSARELGFHLSALAGDSGQRSGAVAVATGKRQIWLKQINGGGETAHTPGPDDDNSPRRFSPDGPRGFQRIGTRSPPDRRVGNHSPLTHNPMRPLIEA
jgi:hypothetical protein